MRHNSISRYVGEPARVFMTVFILLIGLFILLIIGVEIVRSFQRRSPVVQQPQPQYAEKDRNLWKIANSAKEFLPDGTLHLIQQPQDAIGRPDKRGDERVFDVNDNLLWQGPAKDRPYKYLSWAPPRIPGIFARQEMRYLQVITPETSRSLEIPVKTKDDLLQVWRYCPARVIFIGYKHGTKIGCLGAAGFVGSSDAAKSLGSFQSFLAWCPDDSYSPTLLWQTTRRLYQINFETQSMETLFESTAEDMDLMTIHTWGPYRARDPYGADIIDESQAKNYRPLVYCRTQDGKHHLIMQNPSQALTVAIPQQWNKWMGSYCRFTATNKAVFMARQWVEHPAPPGFDAEEPETIKKWYRDYRAKPKQCWVELYRIDNNGSLTLLNRFGWLKPAEPPYPEQPQQIPAYLKAAQRLSVVSPPSYSLVFEAFRAQSL